MTNPIQRSDSFHIRFGGEDGIINRPDELTAEAGAALAKEGSSSQYFIVAKSLLAVSSPEIMLEAYRSLWVAASTLLTIERDLQLDDTTPSIRPIRPASPISWIILNVSKGTSVEVMALSGAMLEDSRYEISVDGFVEGAMVVLRKGVGSVVCDGCLDWEPVRQMKVITMTELPDTPLVQAVRDDCGCDGPIGSLLEIPLHPVVKFPFLSAMFSEGAVVYATEYFPVEAAAHYDIFRMTRATPNPLSILDRFRIEIVEGGDRRSIVVHQHRPVTHGDIHYFLSEGQLDRLDHERLEAFERFTNEATRTVSRDFPGLFDGGVFVVGHPDVQGWLVKGSVVVSFPLVEKMPPRFIALTVEHELLHQVVKDVGLINNRDLMEFFKSIPGAGGKGLVEPPDPFFRFITERFYYETDETGPHGGHPWENVQEFWTSFLHTFTHPNWLEHRFLKLSDTEKQYVYDRYVQALELLGQHFIGLTALKRSEPERYKGLFGDLDPGIYAPLVRTYSRYLQDLERQFKLR